MTQPYPKTRWHQLLGKLLEEWLTPVDIEVHTEIPLTSEPPAADVLLLRRNQKQWNLKQTERLPDGIRQTQASHVLLEFKYSQSLSQSAVFQTISYYYHYQQRQKLKTEQLTAFIIISKTPRLATLRNLGYTLTSLKGVYRRKDFLLKSIGLIVLNELENTAYNAPIKCFASKKREQQKAFDTIRQGKLKNVPFTLERLFGGLCQLLFTLEGKDMPKLDELTPEYVIKEGKKWEKFILANAPIEERLKDLSIEERLKDLSIEEVQEYLDTLKNKQK